MGHLSIENPTPFEFEPLFPNDEEGRPLFVPVIKASYTIGTLGLSVAEKQSPVNLTGELYGNPEESSYRYEPEGAFTKPATDVVLVGHAHAPYKGATEVMVALQVGPLRKGVRVLGDRFFFETLGIISMSRPAPFETIPLQWERAFGGWDRSHPDPRKHQFDPRNPVGRGFRGAGSTFQQGCRAPNLEDPGEPYKGWGHQPRPAGFGFISPNWEPRASLGGTYDSEWEASRAPLLPSNFDRRFMNAASPGLVANGYLRGDEPVVVAGASSAGRLAFRLPGLGQPKVLVERAGLEDSTLSLDLDTVIIDTDAMRVLLLWRGNLLLERDQLEVRSAKLVWPYAPLVPPQWRSGDDVYTGGGLHVTH